MFHTNLALRRVSIVGDNSLFEEGLTYLLSPGNDFDVFNIKYTDDSAFLEAVEQQRPDVILLNESIVTNACHILDLLFSRSTLTALYIIKVRLDNNLVDVYEMPKRFAISKRHELVDVVLGKYQQV